MIHTTLAPFQVEDVQFLLDHPRSANFNDCGLGKTLEELSVIDQLRKRTLVLCPKSCLAEWVDQIESHTSWEAGVDFCVASGSKESKFMAIHSNSLVVITNYETVLSNFDDLVFTPFQHLICDESTRVKNIDAKITQATIAIADRAEVVRIMSGLPAPQTPLELFSQFRIMDRGVSFGKSFYVFRRAYFRPIGFWPVRRWELKDREASSLFDKVGKLSIRRLRNEVYELPPVTTTRRDTTWEDGKTRTSYERLEKATCSEIEIGPDGQITNLPNAMVKMRKLLQYTSGFIYTPEGTMIFKDNPKVKSLPEILDDYGYKENKIIIAGTLTKELDLIYRYLVKEKSDANAVMICGDVGLADRQERLRRFRDDRTCRVLIGNEKTIAYGLNLQHSNIIIFVSAEFSVDQYKQLSDRIARRGQTKNCLLLHVIIPGTFDECRYYTIRHNLDKAQALMKFVKERRE